MTNAALATWYQSQTTTELQTMLGALPDAELDSLHARRIRFELDFRVKKNEAAK